MEGWKGLAPAPTCGSWEAEGISWLRNTLPRVVWGLSPMEVSQTQTNRDGKWSPHGSLHRVWCENQWRFSPPRREESLLETQTPPSQGGALLLLQHQQGEGGPVGGVHCLALIYWCHHSAVLRSCTGVCWQHPSGIFGVLFFWRSSW